jgi:cell division protein FtsN
MAGRSRQAVRSQGGWPAWVWLAIGVVLGVALCALVLLGGHAPSLRGRGEPEPNPHATAPRPSEPGVADQQSKANKDYDFYSVLPEMEVVIPDSELSAKARAEAGKPASATPNAGSDTGDYLLQAGSFPDAADADAVKARLALLGFVANVQPVTINGNTWHRVRLGPYRSAAELEAAKQKLAASGVNAIALKEQ